MQLLVTDRKNLQQMASDILANDYSEHVLGQMRNILSGEISQKYEAYIAPERNILRRVVLLTSQLYARTPRRTGDAAETLTDYCPSLQNALQAAQQRAEAIRDVFLLPSWDIDDKQVRIEIIDPQNVEVKMDRSKCVWIRLKQAENYLWYYSDGTIKKSDSDNIEKASTVKNILGNVCPVVWWSLGYPQEGSEWSITQVADLIAVTINTAIYEAYRARQNYLRSQRVVSMGAIEYDDNTGSELHIPIDMNTIVKGTLTSASLADETDSFVNVIRADMEDAAASRGLSVQAMNKTYADAGILTANKELLAIWYGQSETYRRLERALNRVILATIGAYTIAKHDIDEEIATDYLEPVAMLETSKESLENLEKGIALGITKIEDYIALRNADLCDEDEIEEFIKANTESRARVNNLMREQNMSKNPTDAPGDDPEINGANGPPAISPEMNPDSMRNTNERRE
jgi:hypothetical protein